LQFSAGYFYNVSAELRCTLAARESNSLVPRAVAPGAFLFPGTLYAYRYVIRVKDPPMAEQLLEEGAFEGWEEDLPDVIVEEIPEELTT
jgi:hypothetical protein